MLKQDKNGYYIVESPSDLRYWYKMSDLTTREKLQLKAEMNPPKVTKVKTKTTKKVVEKPEPTAFDKWFN
jgi:hypothetical protein